MSNRGVEEESLFVEDGLPEFETGKYAIPDELTDIGAANAMSSLLDVNKVLVMGRVALLHRKIGEAKNHFMTAAKAGSEEGKFFIGWLNVNTMAPAKGAEMSENAREVLFENLRYMVGAIWEFQKPELIFKLYETLSFILNYGCLEVYSSDGTEKSWNGMLALMQRCMEDGSEENFSRLLSYLTEYCSSREFATAERSWIAPR